MSSPPPRHFPPPPHPALPHARTGTPPLPTPVDYVGLTRPGRRWWRFLVSLLLLGAIVGAGQLIVTLAFIVVGLVAGWDPLWFMTSLVDLSAVRMSPGSLLYVNLGLATLIPASIISTRVAQGIRAGFVHSVAGRFRWALFGQVALLLLPVWLLFLLGSVALSGGSLTDLNPHPQLWALLLVCWLTTPLQSAGEEYAFRGWLLQNLGGLFAIRVLAWALPITTSAILFGFLHGSADPWVLGSLMIMAVATGILTWRSGGLEAAVALHTVNNMVTMHITLFLGGFDAAFVSEDTTGNPLDLLATLVVYAIAIGIVWWWLKRRRVANTTTVDPRIPRWMPSAPAPQPNSRP